MADVQVKICGLSAPGEIAAAAKAGASHVGFVFFDESPRNVRPRDATALAKTVPEGICKVGVFVDPSESLLERAIAAGRLDVLQFHGNESVEQLKKIKGRNKLKLWKAIPVSKASDIEAAKRYEGVVDRIIFDARTPKASRLPGGMGIAFDWNLLAKHNHSLPWALSGGLTPANVGEAIAKTGATFVDVSSGVESEPGIKDPMKISSFMQAVARA